MTTVTKLQLAREWIDKICATLGVNPADVTQISIDIGTDEVAMVRVTLVGTTEIMRDVAAAIAQAAGRNDDN